MERSLIIAYNDLKNKIIKEINESQLSAFMIKPIIKDIYDELIVLEKKEYEFAKNNIKESDK